MSSDLLAEFDSFYKASQDTPSNPTPALNDLALLGATNQQSQAALGGTQSQGHQDNRSDYIWGNTTSFQQVTNNRKVNTVEEDIWGSFEDATQTTTQPPQVRPPATTSYNAAIASKPNQNGPQIVRRPTLDLFSGNIIDSNPLSSVPATKVPGAASETLRQHTQRHVPTISYDGRATAKQMQNGPGIVRRPTVDLFSDNAVDFGSMSNVPVKAPEKAPPQRPVAASKDSFGEILFDAADEISADAEDDEFGDFETFTAEPAAGPSVPASQSLETLFGATTLEPKSLTKPKDSAPTPLTLSAGTLPYPQAPKSPSFQERNPFGQQLGLAMNQVSAVKKADKAQSASPVTAWPSFEAPKPAPYQDSPAPDNQPGDEWGDFEDLPPETPAVASAKAVSGIEADAWAWDTADQVSSEPANVPPPTNIPPPSVLLTLFPPLFDLPKNTLFKGVVNQPFPMKNRILSDPSTVSFLRAYLLVVTVAARIIAGRKLRWKRDTILSQAMKIGPAAAGGKGGMKLTGVDKAEATREERESAEVVRVWKEQLGRLRSAVAVANSSISDVLQHLTIPDISETMHVKSQEGGLTAPKPCIVCGLKREERVNKVDIEVEDSFGEWWVEHWGHRSCKNFWQEQESKLKHR